MNDRQKLIYDFIKKHQPVKVSDISKGLVYISKNMVKKDLLFMKEKELVFSSGKNKGTVYRIND